jgi:FixJ family two-component response regulator
MKDFTLSSGIKPHSALKGHHKILLVDDDTDIVHVLKRGLEIKGFEVHAYDSSREALNAFKPDVYDLAILDIRMPGLSGFKLYREMKNFDPTIIACFLSAFEILPGEFEKMFPSMNGIKAIIKKPVSLNHLLREITPVLRISAIARARKGEHFLVAFDTPQELIDQSLQFLKTGLLEKEEDILLVTDELPKDTIRKKIAKEWNLPDVETLEQQRRITLMTFAEWHLIEGKFNIERSKTMMRKRLQNSVDQGRKGLRSVGDMNPFFSRGMKQDLVSWESSLERQFNLPITSLCVYTINSIKQLNNPLSRIIRQHHNRMMVIGEGAQSSESAEES